MIEKIEAETIKMPDPTDPSKSISDFVIVYINDTEESGNNEYRVFTQNKHTSPLELCYASLHILCGILKETEDVPFLQALGSEMVACLQSFENLMEKIDETDDKVH